MQNILVVRFFAKHIRRDNVPDKQFAVAANSSNDLLLTNGLIGSEPENEFELKSILARFVQVSKYPESLPWSLFFCTKKVWIFVRLTKVNGNVELSKLHAGTVL